MGDLRLNEISYSGNGTGVLMLNGVNYTGVPQYTELTESGEFCSFETDVVVPLKKAIFDIDSSASSIKVTAQSPNFFNEDTELGRINDTTGQPTSQTDVFRSKTFSPCVGGETYYVHVGCGKNIRVYWYASDESFISVTNDVSNANITAPANAAYLKMRSTTTYGTTYLGDISINLANDQDYHPYVTPVSQTINLGTTRTGGFVTVSFDGGCSYDDGAGNVTTLTAINPIMQVYGSNLVYCDTGDTEVTYRVAYASSESAPSFDLKFSNGTAGSSTFTIDEAGVYLLIAVYSLNGSGTITLPAGRTASYTGSVLISNSKGMVINIVELESGDTVTMETSVSSWVANTKVVVKIPTAVTILIDSATAGDDDIEYTLSTGSGEVLCVATAWARLLRVDNIYDISDITDNMIAGIVDTNVYLRIFTCDASDFPTIRMYGYDGGGVAIAVLQ